MTSCSVFFPILLCVCGMYFYCQSDALVPCSSFPGDVMRGEGVKYRGEARLYLNLAKTRSVDTDVLIRFNEYVLISDN